MSGHTLSRGEMLGHYRIVDQVGSGGMGIVFRAHDERLDRDVGLKVLPPGVLGDEAVRRRFRREALALAKLNHPNIATIHDFDNSDGTDFLVMEYVCGVTLADKIRGRVLTEKQIVAIAEQIIKALDCAHSAGIVHRDLKPSNIMITGTGEVKLLDFGLSVLLRRPADASLTETITALQTPAGTLPYMAPEQLKGGSLDGRCDIYAAGVVLYELVTGHRPFAAPLATSLADEILHKRATPPQVFNPRISVELASIILKCLEKEPEDRYQSAKEVLVDLRQTARRGTFIPITETSFPERHRTLLIFFVVAILAFALVLTFLVVRHRAQRTGAPASPTISSLAVLPLENLSAEPAQDYFTDGMTEELIGALAKISTLRVISRASVMQYKGVHKSLREIAGELHVDAVVIGSVARLTNSNKVRITAELVEAATDRNLWAQSYEREIGDIFVLQDEVARNIAVQIRVELTPQEEQRLEDSRRVNTEAHEAYLKGRYCWSKGTEAELRQAKKYFAQAIQIDSGYAPAYSGLADYYWVTDELTPRLAKSMARDYVLKALDLDSDLADAHTTLGDIQFYGDWDWIGAENEFKRAIDLNPSRAEAHGMYSVFLSAMGRTDEAIGEIRSAQELDPLASEPRMIAGRIFYYARQYDLAIEECRRALDVDRSSIAAHDCLAEAYLGKGAYEQAISEFRLVAAASSNDPVRLAGLGRAYALAGRLVESKGILAQLGKASKAHYVPPYFFSMIHAALGDRNQAFSWLETAHNEHDSYLARVRVDPAMDPLRSDQRFAKLLQSMRLNP